MIKMLDLGYAMARLMYDEGHDKLTIVSPSDAGEPSYSPAESVVVCGTKQILALRDALNEVYPPEEVR